MSEPATTKRVLTEDAHSSLCATRLHFGNFVSDDLAARLQNLGSRVRKSVNEGYATQRYGGIPSVTPTPFSSPVKSISVTTSPQSAPIFRSANDTLLDVFSSPALCNGNASPASASQKKRRHAEIDQEEDDGEGSPITTFSTCNGNSAATEMEAASEDEDVMIITEASQTYSPSRPVRPLKRTGRTHHSSGAPSNPPCITKSCFSSSSFNPHTEEATPIASDWKSMFNQPF
ncbi:hypothetical protein ACEPAI_5772 [Sanghuangporus weigelae]